MHKQNRTENQETNPYIQGKLVWNRVKEKSTPYTFRDKKPNKQLPPHTHKKQSPHKTGTLILYFFKEPTPDRFFLSEF